jgi:hypothetical protein
MKTFEIAIEQNGMNDTIKVGSSSILGALEKVHKIMQIENGVEVDGYKIVGGCQVYTDTGGDLIHSSYPLCGGPNPDMWAVLGREKPKSDLTSVKS